MGRRLMLILTCALIVGLALPAYAEVQNVKVSGDITSYAISRTNFGSDSQIVGLQKGDDDESHLASIIRLRIDADLTENVSTTLRLLSERDWGQETVNNEEISLDLAYITLKEFLYSPLTLTLGRQELHFGNDFIIGDPDRNNNVAGTSLTDADLSSKKAFDAIRATFDLDPLVLDIFWAKIQENNVIPTAVAEEKDDVDLWGVNGRYDFGGNWNTIGELYYFGKIDNSVRETNLVNNKKKTAIHNIGGRVEITPKERLNLQAEVTHQFGRNVANTSDTQVRHEAWAAQGIARYALDMKYDPVLMAIYSFYSGNKTGTGTSGTWDPMFENQTSGHIANVLCDPSNFHVVNLRSSLIPLEDLTVTLDFVWFSLAKTVNQGGTIQTFDPAHTAVNRTATGKDHVGNELDVTLTYDYTEDVQLCLLAGVFMPGDALDSANGNVKEVIASVKVSF